MIVRIGKFSAKMDLATFFVIALILGAIATVVLTDAATSNAIWKGSRPYSDPEAGSFTVPRPYLVGLVALILAAFVAMLGLRAILGDVENRFVEAQTIAIGELKERRRIEQEERELERTKQLEKRIAELSDQLIDLREVVLPDGRRVYYGATDRTLGTIHTRTTEIRVDNGATYDEYVIVVHLLQDVAYWDLGSANYFVDDNGKDVKLLDQLKQEEVRSSLIQFEHVAGVGLESRTAQDQKGLSDQRANTLCTALHNAVKDTRKTSALGMSIGRYTGEFQESSKLRENRQRSVIIIGIKTLHHAVGYQDVVRRVLSSIQLPGIDFSKYEGFQVGGEITWTRMADCDLTRDFLIDRRGDPIRR